MTIRSKSTLPKKTPSFSIRMLSFLPMCLMLFLIFGFSAQTGETSGSLSYRISCSLVELTGRLFRTDWGMTEIAAYADSIHLLIRKAAHVTEYFILTFTVYLPVHFHLAYLKHLGSAIWKRLLFTGAVTVVFAALDEFHQTFVDGRAGTPVDVCIDSIGIVMACMILALITALIQRRKRMQQFNAATSFYTV